ncbi:hypothetical protein [Flavobacterium alkalisoli]|uniref:hypothetical protein n=1 Tax=Flavobacterium alkalisoli TaxID=2602769 RepID=UPI003A953A3D
MKNPFLLLLFFLSCSLNANMAQPYIEGSLSGTPFISKYAAINHEKISITTDADFQTAFFDIEYHITCDKDGHQIPLLFYAIDFKKEFSVWVDDIPIYLLPLPFDYKGSKNNAFSDFTYLYESDKELVLSETDNSSFGIRTEDLKFFKADLSKGNHIIKVQYTANAWNYYSSWVQKDTFKYALSPANYWKSYGTLEIWLNNTKNKKPITTNFGEPNSTANQQLYWKFTKIPVNMMEIYFEPEIPNTAQILIDINPFRLMLILGAIIMIIHILAIRYYRKKHFRPRFSWVVITGSIIFPFIILFSYMVFYWIIDWIIGENATQRHGYIFLIIAFYPVVLIIYWILMWLVDYTTKKQMKKSNI